MPKRRVEIERIGGPRIYVTDHAVVKYMERVLGVDVEQLRAVIAARATLVAPGSVGTCKVTIDGFRFVIRGTTVMTILPPRKRRR